MNQDQAIARYESVADITGHMLAAARNRDWEALGALESDCASQVRRLENAEIGALLTDLTDAQRLRKRTLIEKILADDRKIRDLTEPWMAQLSSLLNQVKIERQLSMAYGNHQTH